MFRKIFAPLFAVVLSVSLFQAPAARAAQMLDVIFLVDGSGSITSDDFTVLKDGTLDIANTLATGIPGAGEVPDPGNPGSFLPADLLGADLNVGLVQFATTAQLDLGLTGDLATVDTALTNMAQLEGQTNHAAALELARTELAANGRAGALQAIIMLTDGVPNETNGPSDPLTDAIIQSILAKSDGILIYGVAIGGQSVLEAIEDYASSPKEDFTALIDEFDALDTVNLGIAEELLESGFQQSAAVSAPAPLAILGLGIAGLACLRRRRSARA
jgi:hypothetical protein